MEISSIHSPKFRIGDLITKFSSCLPNEYNILKENEANNFFASELKNIITDPEIFEQLENDCSLENLYFDGEFATLEGILKIIPSRKGDERELKTLTHLLKETEGLSSRTSILTATQRIPRPFIDMSYRNSVEESTEATEVNQDIFVTVLVYRPFCLPNMDPCIQSRQLVITQRLVLLSKQNLTVLRDAIKCPQDKVWLGDCSEALDVPELHVSADKLYTSSYFFIEGKFYDDLRNANSKSLGQEVIQWAKSKRELVSCGPFTSSPMESITLENLAVCIGKPYFFVHQGNCEHMIIFSDIRLVDRDSCQSESSFPMLTGRCSARILHCFACRRLACRWIVTECRTILPVDPCPICDVCIRLLLYTADGKKIDPHFRVLMYCGEEIVM
uniref:snRNA-activating protein complex subunit 3 n=1 Tax=Schistosoma japonicum TaxID=6182 RepID=C1LIY9_SCHJA|nr:snRNA-activating protein complex subunit 3 [Schistosoma japonicum]CAX74667.1 snRNA-activating protein complex subunit 3 [Schistosoma japonicum]